jgi:hypothetical protein
MGIITTTGSITMDLENLQQTQSNLVIQYKQAVADYVAYLQTNSNNSPSLVSISGRAFAGTGSAGQSTATTLQECQSACAANSSCSGATFVSSQCQLRTGDTPLVPASLDSYAIIPKAKQLLLNMESLNAQLISLNQQIQEKIELSKTSVEDAQERSAIASQELVDSYKELDTERTTLEQLLSEYDALDANEMETDVKITQRYYTYLLLIGLAIAIVVLLSSLSVNGTVSPSFFSRSYRPSNYNVQYGRNDLGSTAYFILFLVILAVIILNAGWQYLTLNPFTEFLHKIYTWIPFFQIQPI